MIAPDPVIAAHPVGSVTRTAFGPEGLATATYDRSGRRRFRLSRVWDPEGSRCVFVMLNPSMASETVLDPTVTRCVRFAESWGHGALEVVNIFAFRATAPRDLKAAPDPVGRGNNQAIIAAVRSADVVMAAWGIHGAHRGRGREVQRLLAGAGVSPMCLRMTKDGHPGHPLYVRSDIHLSRFGCDPDRSGGES